MSSKYSIPMSSPDITDLEREAVSAVLDTPFLSQGKEIIAFEQAVCDYTGSQHAIAVNSGTAGLHLCVRSAGIQRGDLVITTPFSFVASANVLLYEGAIPIFVDIDPKTGNISSELMEQAAADLMNGVRSAKKWLPRRNADDCRELRAILSVDVFGQPADMDPIRKIADEYNLRLIEDSCEALGAQYKTRQAGTLGDYGVFAFYPNKQITTGEGGIIITNDGDAAGLMRALRNQGRGPGDTWLSHTHLGYNYRLDELSAALGRVQVNRLDELLGKRQQVADWYNERIAEMPYLEAPTTAPETTRMSWFVYVVRVSASLNRDEVAQKLENNGIPVRPYFPPIHLQPYMAEKFDFRRGDFPVTEDLGRRGLALPFSGLMRKTDVDQVCLALESACQ